MLTHMVLCVVSMSSFISQTGGERQHLLNPTPGMSFLFSPRKHFGSRFQGYSAKPGSSQHKGMGEGSQEKRDEGRVREENRGQGGQGHFLLVTPRAHLLQADPALDSIFSYELIRGWIHWQGQNLTIQSPSQRWAPLRHLCTREALVNILDLIYNLGTRCRF